jgi:hypothetical protein
MDRLSIALRIAVAVALLLVAGLELLRFLSALGTVVGVYVEIAHGALALLAALAGTGLWLRTPWAPVAIVALGCVFAATRMIDALVLGIRPWLLALLAALAAVVAAVVLAAWARSEARLLT